MGQNPAPVGMDEPHGYGNKPPTYRACRRPTEVKEHDLGCTNLTLPSGNGSNVSEKHGAWLIFVFSRHSGPFRTCPHQAAQPVSRVLEQSDEFRPCGAGPHGQGSKPMGCTTILVYFSGDWDAHRGYGVLTHGHISLSAVRSAWGLQNTRRQPGLLIGWRPRGVGCFGTGSLTP